jgi:hypothetical protein
MNKTKQLVIGRLVPQDLLVSVSDSTRKIQPEVEAQVDVLWEEKKKKAEQEGRVCFNGISYRLNSLEEKNGKVVIDFGLLEYKARHTLIHVPGYLELGEGYYHKGCYTGATVKTTDGMFLVVELSGKSMNTFPIDMLGGIMEKPSEIYTGEDVFDCIYGELEEEACITKDDIKECYLRSIFLTPNTHTCFYFEVSLNISSESLLSRFSTENKDQDIQSLKVLSQEEYVSFLRNHSSPAKQFISEIINI